MNIEIWRHGHGDMQKSKRKQTTKTQMIFLNPFTVCSSHKPKFVVCPFVDEETNGRFPFANGLTGLNGLAHPWVALQYL